MNRMAVTRDVSPEIGRCELTHLDRKPIDYERAVAQHEGYRAVLAALGCEVLRLPAAADYPDSVFVEDTAIVLDTAVVITRPGAASRRGETDLIEQVLAPRRDLFRMTGPGTLDGGDVMRLERTLVVGLSGRTTEDGAQELARLVEPRGFRVRTVTVSGCLHLKSAVTAVGQNRVLLNPEWVDPAAFRGTEVIEVHPAEPAAANALRVGDTLVYPAAHVLTAELLRHRGHDVRVVDASELAKAEGGVTCCSLILEQE